jgi:hypothetical protein
VPLIRAPRPATIASMNRKPLMGALLVAAATLLATGAYAQNNNAAPQGKANAADKAAGAGDKAGEKKADNAAKPGDPKAGENKAGDKPGEKGADKADDKGKSEGDRAAKKAKERDALKEKLKGKLKGPMDEAMKQELRRHAERLAKLERIKSVATTEKDNANAEKATSLIAKENARHDKWMDKFAANPGGGAGGAAGAADKKDAPKEGAK